MCEHPHLLVFDPRLIICLLHTNINYNYFTFADLTFQQTKGTAMGAAFSPTIANIYMSTILRDFLRSQTTQPLIIKRYIHDILMIWTDTTEELNNFLTNLNFTHEYSYLTIDFLDLTIYKGTHFPYTNLLDTKTFQNHKTYTNTYTTDHHTLKTFIK